MKPGIRWVLLLGGAGFIAGFFGPIVLVPEANQGPLVGIFITGPLGTAAGLIAWLVCRALNVEAHIQWRILIALCVVLVITTLLVVRP